MVGEFGRRICRPGSWLCAWGCCGTRGQTRLRRGFVLGVDLRTWAWRWRGELPLGAADCAQVRRRPDGRAAALHSDIRGGRKAFIGMGCVYGCNTSESIIMTRRPPTTEIRIVLRTILSAGVLAVLLVLACAGAAAGATWVVDDDGGAGCVGMQAEAAG